MARPGRVTGVRVPYNRAAMTRFIVLAVLVITVWQMVAQVIAAREQEKRRSAGRGVRQPGGAVGGGTGGPAAGGSGPALDPRSEAARQRRVQLEELRRRREISARQPAPGRPVAPGRTAPVRSTDTAPVPVPARPATARPVGMAPTRGSADPEAARRLREAEATARAEARRRAIVGEERVEAARREARQRRHAQAEVADAAVREAPSRADTGSAAHRAGRAAAVARLAPGPDRAPRRGTPDPVLLGMLHDRTALRRAIVLTTVLGPPVSLTGPADPA